MGRRPFVRRRWRHGSPFPVCQGMPPPAPRPPRSPRQFRLRSRTPVVPSCPASRQMVSRSCRPAVSDAPCCPSKSGTSFSIRPRRLKCGNVANPCQPVHLPGPVQNALPFRKRHLDVDSRKLRLPRPCRIPAGCPVARSVEVASDHTAIQRRQNGVSVPLAPRRHQNRMFSSLAVAALHADLAPRHYRKPAPARAVAVVVTGRRPRRPHPRQRGPDARRGHPGHRQQHVAANLAAIRHEHHVCATDCQTPAPGRSTCRSVANLTVIPRTNPISCASARATAPIRADFGLEPTDFRHLDECARPGFLPAGPIMAGSSLRAMINLLDAVGGVSSARTAAPAEDLRSRLTRWRRWRSRHAPGGVKSHES